MSTCLDAEEVTWVDIPGTNGAYQISNTGLVRSLKSQKRKVLKPHIAHDRKENEHPLERVYFSLDGKKTAHTVQRLLAICFIGPPPNSKSVARLIDPVKPPTLDNIEWASAATARRSFTCPKGHDYFPDNFYQSNLDRVGELRCKICHREQSHAYARRRNGWQKKTSDSKNV